MRTSCPKLHKKITSSQSHAKWCQTQIFLHFPHLKWKEEHRRMYWYHGPNTLSCTKNPLSAIFPIEWREVGNEDGRVHRKRIGQMVRAPTSIYILGRLEMHASSTWLVFCNFDREAKAVFTIWASLAKANITIFSICYCTESC